MATTSTNKQPLLIDRTLHKHVDTATARTGNTDTALSNNSCKLLVNCTQNDGAILEDVYIISRRAQSGGDTVNFYLAQESNILREGSGNVFYVGRVTSGDAIADVVHWNEIPFVLAPSVGSVAVDTVPGTAVAGDGAQRSAGTYRAFYVPKGYALWCGRAVSGTGDLTNAPIVGAQGGFF
jgi:hypothetical protein